MQSNKLSTNKLIETDRPAPLMPGFYSLQALSDDGVLPNITQYHKKPEPAVNWKNYMAKKRLHDAYVLCSSESRWDVFGKDGKLVGNRNTITPDSGLYMESHNPTSVDPVEYETSVKEVIGSSVTCVVFAEHHSHASSVGHSNMVAVARNLILDASEEDAKHIYLADSIASGCRVQGWFIDLQFASLTLTDKYLDRYKWLANGWPLANDHHLQVMAYRMATLRPLQLLDILIHASRHAYLGEHSSLVAMRVQSTKPEKLIALANAILTGMESCVYIPKNRALEVIEDDDIAEHAPRIANAYKQVFAFK
jgi:hypothetical protein